MHYFQQLTESDITKEYLKLKNITREYLQNYWNKLITEKKIINKINYGQDSYRINRDILKIYEFDQAPAPVSLSNFHLIIPSLYYFLH